MSIETVFAPQQAELVRRIDSGNARYVFLDPDGTWSDWIVLIVEAPTGAIYGTQCAGTATEERFVEGYLVPLGGLLVNAEDGVVASAPLTTPFHDGARCTRGWFPLDGKPLDSLTKAIAQIPVWHFRNSRDSERGSMELDAKRIDQMCEGWVAVKTPLGPGVLLWDNCD